MESTALMIPAATLAALLGSTPAQAAPIGLEVGAGLRDSNSEGSHEGARLASASSTTSS